MQTIVQGTVSAQTTVVVRDLVNGINLVEIEVGDTLDCHINAYAFAPTIAKLQSALQEMQQKLQQPMVVSGACWSSTLTASKSQQN